MDSTTGAISFETALGRCAVRWTGHGISGVLLPGSRGIPAAFADPPGRVQTFVRRAVDGIIAVLDGAAVDLADIPLDDRALDALRLAVTAATRRIPVGATRTYGQIAADIGRPGDARDVGAALARNPFPIIVPCHRVVAADGALTGFSAPGGIATKRRMLELEGAPGYGQQRLFG